MVDLTWHDDIITNCDNCYAPVTGCYWFALPRLFVPLYLCLECVDELRQACEAALEAK